MKRNNLIQNIQSFKLPLIRILLVFGIFSLIISCEAEDDIPPPSAYVAPEPVEGCIFTEIVPELAEGIDFECGAPEFNTFGEKDGSITVEPSDNPDKEGINTSDKVMMVTQTAGVEVWAGFTFDLASKIDFSEKQTIKIKVYSPAEGQNILLKLEDQTDATINKEVSMTTTVADEWEEISFAFSPSDSDKFDRLVLFFNFNGDKDATTVHYFDDIVLAAGGGGITGDSLKLPIDFDGSVDYASKTSGGSFEVVSNPNLSGANSTDTKVGSVTNNGEQYEAITVSLDEAIDFSGSKKTITMKVYSETAYPVLFKLETGVNGERANEVKVDHGGTGWELLTFDFNTAVKSYIDGNQGVGEAFVPIGQYAKFSIFLDFAGTTAGTFYIDDIIQKSGGTGGGAADCIPETEENIDAANGPINWTFMTDDADHEFDQFGDVQTDIVANPVTDGINQSCSVQMIKKAEGCQTWSGLGTAIPTAIDFTTTDKKVFKLKILAQDQLAAVTLRLEREPYPDVEPAEERIAEITEVGVWQELTFDFSDVNDKTFRSIIIYFERDVACDGDVYYFDDLVQTGGTGGTGGGSTGSTTTSFPVDFETAANGGASENWAVFENVDNPALEIISNPDMTGNTSSTVAKFTARQDGNPWAGTETVLQSPFTLDASNSTVKIWVWKSVISDVGIKFANAAGGSTGEIKVANTKTNEWEELTFDFSGVIGDPNNTDITNLVVFPDFQDRSQENVVYFDNIEQN